MNRALLFQAMDPKMIPKGGPPNVQSQTPLNLLHYGASMITILLVVYFHAPIKVLLSVALPIPLHQMWLILLGDNQEVRRIQSAMVIDHLICLCKHRLGLSAVRALCLGLLRLDKKVKN